MSEKDVKTRVKTLIWESFFGSACPDLAGDPRFLAKIDDKKQPPPPPGEAGRAGWVGGGGGGWWLVGKAFGFDIWNILSYVRDYGRLLCPKAPTKIHDVSIKQTHIN